MPTSTLARAALGTLKWLLIIAVVLFLLFAALAWYTIASHDTEHLPEHHGKVHSELFVGAGPKQRLLVGFGGSEGGNAWASDRWQAQRQRFLDRGYAFLALGYFGAEGIPRQLDRISLDAVHEAIVAAASDPRIDASCIGLIGGSKGAELALVLASQFDDIDGVVAIVPGHAVFAGLTDAMTTSSFTLAGTPLPFVPVPWSTTPALLTGDLRRAFELMIADTSAVQPALIPVERINGPILFVSARKDEFWPSTEMSELMMQRLNAHASPHAHQHLAIDGDHAAPLDHFAAIEGFLDTRLCR